MIDFIKLKPFTFSGSNVEEDAKQFLDDIEKLCQPFGCLDEQYVEFPIFQLKNIIEMWIRSIHPGKQARYPLMSWEESRKKFLNQFLPQSV